MSRGALTTVHVDDARTWRGGQAQVLLLLQGLREAGQKAVLVSPEGSPLVLRARLEGFEVLPLRLGGEWDLASALSLASLLRRTRADVVHAHTAHAVTVAGIAGRLARTPLVVASRRVDFPVSRPGRLKLAHLAHVVAAVSEGVRRVLVASGVPRDRIAVVRSGIDLEAVRRGAAPMRFRSDLGLGGGPLVGAVGALADHKDHRTFVEAAARLSRERRDLRFAVVGEGGLREQLERQVREHGLEGVFLLPGFREDMSSVLAALDVYVLSSHSEGLGTSVLDAMAAGVPVVATAVGGVPEMVEDGREGILVPPRDPAALAAAIRRVLCEPGLRAHLVREARSTVSEHFSARRMVSETVGLYAEWLQKRP